MNNIKLIKTYVIFILSLMNFWDKIFSKNRAESALAPSLSQEIRDAKRDKVPIIEKGSCCGRCANWDRDSYDYGRCKKIWIKNANTGRRLFVRVHKKGVCSNFVKSEDYNNKLNKEKQNL